MTLNQVRKDIWDLEVPFNFGLGASAMARMTVIRLADGRLILHSPTGITESVIQDLKDLGDVAYIVAPNRYHHMSVPAAAAAFPHAEIWGAPGLAEKRRDIAFMGTLIQDDPPWGDELQCQLIGGSPMLSEVVFFHPESAAMVCTDLFFNIHEGATWHAKLVLQFLGAWKHPQQSMTWRALTRDKLAMSQSVTEILKWPIECAIPAHGRVLDSETARVDFLGAIPWMLRQQQAKLLEAK